jgi:hypothetical protein
MCIFLKIYMICVQRDYVHNSWIPAYKWAVNRRAPTLHELLYIQADSFAPQLDWPQYPKLGSPFDA